MCSGRPANAPHYATSYGKITDAAAAAAAAAPVAAPVAAPAVAAPAVAAAASQRSNSNDSNVDCVSEKLYAESESALIAAQDKDSIDNDEGKKRKSSVVQVSTQRAEALLRHIMWIHLLKRNTSLICRLSRHLPIHARFAKSARQIATFLKATTMIRTKSATCANLLVARRMIARNVSNKAFVTCAWPNIVGLSP